MSKEDDVSRQREGSQAQKKGITAPIATVSFDIVSPSLGGKCRVHLKRPKFSG